MMIMVAICDDENVIINQIEEMLKDICKTNDIIVDIDSFNSGEAVKKEILAGTKYDLLYLDIYKEHEEGMIVVEHIRKMDEKLKIICVSANEKYCMELFQYDVAGFIKKPIQKDIFARLFYKVYDRLCNDKFYFQYNYKKMEYRKLCSDILYFESEGRKIKIHMRNGEVEKFNGKISDIENQLKKVKIPFLRIHQSYLVNYDYIKARSKTKVVLINNENLQISEARQRKINQKYERLLRGNVID